MRLIDQVLHFPLHGNQGFGQWPWTGDSWVQSRKPGSEHQGMQAGEEQGDLAAVGCDQIAVRVGNPPNDALEP